jgi:hypothetical protein
MIMKCIHDLVRETNKPVYVVNGGLNISIQQPDGTAERSAVTLCRHFAAGLTDFMKDLKHGRSVLKLKIGK